MYLKNSKIIVVKIGSSLLVNNERKIRKKWLSTFARDIKRLRSKNKKVIIVSSGAIALGCKKMNYQKKRSKARQKSSYSICWSNRIDEFIFTNIFKI